MNPGQMQKLGLAAGAAVEGMVSRAFSMPENARECKKMQDESRQKCKTKPTTGAWRAAPRQAQAAVPPRQTMAARLLLAGRTILHVAGELGVNPCTIHRWKRDPRFVAEVERLAGGSIPQPPCSNTPLIPTHAPVDPAGFERHQLDRLTAQLKQIQAQRRR